MTTRLMGCLFVALAAAVAATAAEPALNLGPETVAAPKAPGEVLQSQPAVAFNGETFLVVWQAGSFAPGEGTDICAARLDKDGQPLDPEGFAVCRAKEHQQRPVVAACGKDFLVGIDWKDIRSNFK